MVSRRPGAEGASPPVPSLAAAPDPPVASPGDDAEVAGVTACSFAQAASDAHTTSHGSRANGGTCRAMQLELPLPVICGQLLVVGFYGTELPASVARALSAGERGGAVLFKRNLSDDLAQIAALCRSLRDAGRAEMPPLIGVDQEGGRVTRLPAPALHLPPMAALGKLGN